MAFEIPSGRKPRDRFIDSGMKSLGWNEPVSPHIEPPPAPPTPVVPTEAERIEILNDAGKCLLALGLKRSEARALLEKIVIVPGDDAGQVAARALQLRNQRK